MNEDRTCANESANLTRLRSPDVPDIVLPELPFDLTAARSFIYAERRAAGALTPLGRRYSKFGEQMENFVNSQTLAHALLLRKALIQTYAEIKSLSRVRIAAPTLALPKGNRA